ncbi:hypothetical protein [Rhodococcus sovatensis]|uniref:Uncharacterized protein n=1 Tax=Rhodococcus sovatensis TaxID=1805840 RepID=A0ABZ2PM01_9NOCA
MIDPVWAGVVGTAVGAVAGSAASLLAPLINWRTEKQRLEVEKENAKDLFKQQHELELVQIDRQAKLADLDSKRTLVTTWRDGVAQALDEWTEDDIRSRTSSGPTSALAPTYRSAAGKAWFASLRPNLDTSIEDVDYLAKQMELMMFPEYAKTLFDEIARIESEWGLR